MAWDILVLKVVTITLFINNSIQDNHSLSTWNTIEEIAETHSYVVGVVDIHIIYLCTGTIISEQAVLTSGHCASNKIKYVAVGTGILNNFVSHKNLFRITKIKVHNDYSYKIDKVNTTDMHSNIALVLVEKKMDNYVQIAIISNYFATELKGRELVAVGYGKRKPISETYVLQELKYRQTSCINPKWYYCVCGIEIYNINVHNTQPFGEGGPVILDDEIVGVIAASCGSLQDPSTGLEYNIFTVIAPYIPWIEKSIAKKTTFRNNFSIPKKCDFKNSSDNKCINFILICVPLFNNFYTYYYLIQNHTK